MAEVGDGIGLEVTESSIRAVRLDHTVPGRLLTAFEVPVGEVGAPASPSASPRPSTATVARDGASSPPATPLGLAHGAGDDRALWSSWHVFMAHAMDVVAGRLGDIGGVPTTIGLFPGDATLQTVDITARLTPEVEALRTVLGGHDVAAMIEIELGTRRTLGALRWDQSLADAVVAAARRAGFAGAHVEPAPVSVACLYEEQPALVRRWVPGGVRWQAIVERGAPVVAVSAPVATGRSGSGIDVTSLDRQWLDGVLRQCGTILDTSTSFEIAAEAVRLHGRRPNDVLATVAGVQVSAPSSPSSPSVDDDPLGTFAVALGAAVRSAHLAGHSSATKAIKLDRSVAPPPGSSGPWVVDRVGEVAEAPAPLLWWRRVLDAIFGQPARRSR